MRTKTKHKQTRPEQAIYKKTFNYSLIPILYDSKRRKNLKSYFLTESFIFTEKSSLL